MHTNPIGVGQFRGSRSYRPCHGGEKKTYGGWLRPIAGRFRLRAISISRQPTHEVFLPAAGYLWNDELNNAGSNGNYWSSTLNESNPNNAYNLNSGNANWNNNNRNNGQSVRPVRQHLPTHTR